MTVKTPCIGICTATALGDAICRGCKRTFEEVRDWNAYSDAQKIEINRRLKMATLLAAIRYLRKQGMHAAAEKVQAIDERLQVLERDPRLSDDPLTALAAVMRNFGLSIYTAESIYVTKDGEGLIKEIKSFPPKPTTADDIKPESDKQ